jgi:hypothetical protein
MIDMLTVLFILDRFYCCVQGTDLFFCINPVQQNVHFRYCFATSFSVSLVSHRCLHHISISLSIIEHEVMLKGLACLFMPSPLSLFSRLWITFLNDPHDSFNVL